MNRVRCLARFIRPELTQLEDRCLPAVIHPINDSDYDPNSILVRFNSVTDADAYARHVQRTTSQLAVSGEVANILVPGLRTITFNGSQVSVTQMMETLAQNPSVSYVEANYIMRAQVTPNDTRFGELYGMNNTGQTINGTPGIADADVDAPEAWDISTGSGNFVIAVVDTGVDYTHPDLAGNIWTNPGEIAGDGIDNDGNGLIDDTRGWDFVNDDNNPMDDNSHGTHCAGTIGGFGNNGAGVTGANWRVKIMPLKFLSAGGSGSTDDALSCLNYAVTKGAKISSNSWGGGGFSASFSTALDNARTQGHLFVAAAGNAANNNDATPFYPATYPQDNIISVASTTNRDQLSGFSCFGATTVDIGAPGSDILSTVPGGGYGYKSGTSMATPLVAGAAALIWDKYGQFSYSDITRRLYATVDPLASLNGRVASNGRLNLFKSVRNLAPVAVADAYGMNQGTTLNVPVNFGVLSNDTDAEKDPITAQLVTAPANGTLTLNANGSFSYTPTPLFSGTVTFSYVANDFALSSAVTVVTIDIAATNVAPVAQNDGIYIARPGVAFTLPASGVLANDSDPDGPSSGLTAIRTTNVTKGTVTLNANGSLTYTANANAAGLDSFQYVASDGLLNSAPATVTFRINRQPTVQNASLLTKINTAAGGNLLSLASDGDLDPLTASIVSFPANGTVSLNPTTGVYTYTPNAGFGGLDTFTYRVNDGWENSATATISIRVDRLPVANPDFFTIRQNTPVELFAPGILSNDTDADIPQFPDVLSAELVTNVGHGTLNFGINGYIKYTPNNNFVGTDSFTYRISDGFYTGNTATVTFTVNSAPVANPDAYVTFSPLLTVPSSSGVLVNDTSPNSNFLTARLISPPVFGSLTLNPDGSFVYQAANNYTGPDSFRYVANDGFYDSDPATVNLTVFAMNHPPVAVNDAYTVTANGILTIPSPGVLNNDTDPENNALVATLVSGTSNGTLVLYSNGSFTYTPQQNFQGVDSFTYQASDTNSLSNVATVTITVGSPTPVTNPNRRVILGQESGGELKVLAGETGATVFTITPYAGHSGGIRVAMGDVNADGVPDIITAPGSGSGGVVVSSTPRATPKLSLPVLVFDGVTGQQMSGKLGLGFYPFGNNYAGGIQVAAGDVNGDGRADIVVSADANPGGPWVRTYNAASASLFSTWIGGFSPYTGSSFGGVRVTVGDVVGDGRAEIITAPAAGTPIVRIYNANAATVTAGLVRSFTAYSSNVAGGVFLATGNLRGDGKAEIITGAASNTNGHVRIFNGSTGTVLSSLTVAGSTTGPARVAVGDVNGDGVLDLLVGISTGSASRARAYDAATLSEMLGTSYVYGGGYNGGLFTAALGKLS